MVFVYLICYEYTVVLKPVGSYILLTSVTVLLIETSCFMYVKYVSRMMVNCENKYTQKQYEYVTVCIAGGMQLRESAGCETGARCDELVLQEASASFPLDG